jgi:hypothetical protein
MSVFQVFLLALVGFQACALPRQSTNRSQRMASVGIGTQGNMEDGASCERHEQCVGGVCTPVRCRKICVTPPPECGLGRHGVQAERYAACGCTGRVEVIWRQCNTEYPDYAQLLTRYGDCSSGTFERCERSRFLGEPCDVSRPRSSHSLLMGDGLDMYEGLAIRHTVGATVLNTVTPILRGRVSTEIEALPDMGFFVDRNRNARCDPDEPAVPYYRSFDGANGILHFVLLADGVLPPCTEIRDGARPRRSRYGRTEPK